MAKDETQLDLTIVALVALVAIVGLVALVMNSAAVTEARFATGSQLTAAQAGEQNVIGYDICAVIKPTGCTGRSAALE